MAGRKLKVFQAQFGFFDSVVAAPSKAAALRAWGIRQDLFADGQAREIDDALAVRTALEHPEVPLRRALGSSDPFAVEPTSLPKVPDAPKTLAAKSSATKGRPAPAPVLKPRADRSKLDAAELTLRRVDEDRKREEAAFRLRKDELEAEMLAAQSRYVDKRKTATAAVVDARQTYRDAGGDD